MASEPKLCINCQYVGPENSNPTCSHEKAPRSPVDGSPTASCLSLRQNRATPTTCGIEGSWYVAKEEEEESP